MNTFKGVNNILTRCLWDLGLVLFFLSTFPTLSLSEGTQGTKGTSHCPPENFKGPLQIRNEEECQMTASSELPKSLECSGIANDENNHLRFQQKDQLKWQWYFKDGNQESSSSWEKVDDDFFQRVHSRSSISITEHKNSSLSLLTFRVLKNDAYDLEGTFNCTYGGYWVTSLVAYKEFRKATLNLYPEHKEETQETVVTLEEGKYGTLDCSFNSDSYPPVTSVTWHRKFKVNERSYDWKVVQEDKLEHSTITNSDNNHSLHFTPFMSKEHAGDYKCVLIQHKDYLKIEKHFYVKAFTWISVLVIAIVIVVTLIGCFIGVMNAVYNKRYENMQKQLMIEDGTCDMNANNGRSLNDLRIKIQDVVQERDFLTFPVERMSIGEMIHKGDHGTLYKATSTSAAQESLTVRSLSSSLKLKSRHASEVINDLNVLGYLESSRNCANIIKLIGISLTNDATFIIFEFCQFGSLRDFLKFNRERFQLTAGRKKKSRTLSETDEETEVMEGAEWESKTLLSVHMNNKHSTAAFTNATTEPAPISSISCQPLNSTTMLGWGFQAARALEYMASKKVIHNGIAAGSCLLADDLVLKLSNFKNAQILSSNDEKTTIINHSIELTKWMALESLTNREFSFQSDVWCFGVLLWEIFTLAEDPFTTPESYPEFLDKLQKGLRLPQPKQCPDEIYSTMLTCWTWTDGSNTNCQLQTRPDFHKLSGLLGEKLKAMQNDYYNRLTMLTEITSEIAHILTVQAKPEENNTIHVLRPEGESNV